MPPILRAERFADRRDQAHFAGCLLGGAVGDALGAPVEFLSLSEIRARFGPGGIHGFVPAYDRVGAITDDTQMTLFTAEGLIRGDNRAREKGIGGGPIHCVHHAYLRWYETQGGRAAYPSAIKRIHSNGYSPQLCIRRDTNGQATRPAEIFRASRGSLVQSSPIASKPLDIIAASHGLPPFVKRMLGVGFSALRTLIE